MLWGNFEAAMLTSLLFSPSQPHQSLHPFVVNTNAYVVE